jgi:uncharacterized lipoprotein NlpE involved in copper resistance
MKKLIVVIASVFCLAGCGNRQLIDTNYSFNKVVISLNDDVTIKGEVESWRDFDDGDMIQVTVNGKTYLTHSSNVILIHE